MPDQNPQPESQAPPPHLPQPQEALLFETQVEQLVASGLDQGTPAPPNGMPTSIQVPPGAILRAEEHRVDVELSLRGPARSTIWRVWASNNTTPLSSTTSGSISSCLWVDWVKQATSTSMTYSYSGTANNLAHSIWNGWVRQPADGYITRAYPYAPPAPETAEQRQARLAREEAAAQERARRQAELAERHRQAEAKRALAERRAKKLLIESLSPEQRDELLHHGYFTVRLPNGHAYRITKAYSHNVIPLRPDGQPSLVTLCAHPESSIPVYDSMLAQKLMLEAAEHNFLAIANRGGTSNPRAHVPWLGQKNEYTHHPN